jgi:hypothetical protein
MNASNSIEQAWISYQTTKTCLTAMARAVQSNDLALIAKTPFLGSTQDDALRQIEDSRVHADDYIILTLWAFFEQALISYLKAEHKKTLLPGATTVMKAAQRKVEREIEYWRTDDIISLFTDVFDPHLLGQVKQVKQYRDWIAHRNPRKRPGTIVYPDPAYQVLQRIVQQLDAGSASQQQDN